MQTFRYVLSCECGGSENELQNSELKLFRECAIIAEPLEPLINTCCFNYYTRRLLVLCETWISENDSTIPHVWWIVVINNYKW